MESRQRNRTTHSQTLTQEEEMISENLKRIMFEKKTRLPSLRNKHQKIVKT